MIKRSAAPFAGRDLQKLKSFLETNGLSYDENINYSLLFMDEDERILAAGSLDEDVIKGVCVDPEYRSLGLMEQIVTGLVFEAASRGITHLFVYTKPENLAVFLSLGFYEIVRTKEVLLLENVKNGPAEEIRRLEKFDSGQKIGAVICNCNPFTKGHRYLIETAAADCDRLYVFVVSAEKSMFSFSDRLKMVRTGCADLSNVCICPSGRYIISGATFPDYFLSKEKKKNSGLYGAELDVAVFCRYYIPGLGIKVRYVGTEPFSEITDEYNRILQEQLQEYGAELCVIPRYEIDGRPVSATDVRYFLSTGQAEKAMKLLPDSTLRYLEEKAQIDLINARDQRMRWKEAFFSGCDDSSEEIVPEARKETMISFGMNIPGPVKNYPLAAAGFHYGEDLLKRQLKRNGIRILRSRIREDACGKIGLYAVDAEAEQVKRLMVEAEEKSEIGRLFDLDVLSCGKAVSREELGLPARKCFICGEEARICAGRHTHAKGEAAAYARELLRSFFSRKWTEHLVALSVRSLMYELAVTPKPGLVDRNNSGSHTDMDYFSFVDSIAVLQKYFTEVCQRSLGRQDDPEALFREIRFLGMEAEEQMYKASNGANTYKGIIFSFGLFLSAAAALYRSYEAAEPALDDIRMQVIKMCRNTLEEEVRYLPDPADSGARGEAIKGFASASDIGMQVLLQASGKGYDLNTAGIFTLLKILAELKDTNIIRRSGEDHLREVQNDLVLWFRRNDLLSEYCSTDLGKRKITEYASQLDERFISEGISPGGAADNLALAFLMFFISECD